MIFLIFVFSILIHELSHVFIGFVFGYKLRNFHFVPFGTAIEFKEFYKSKFLNIKKIIIYISGPISNLVICVISYCSDFKIKEEIFYTNLILAIFNLLPLMPLDGGKILKEFLKIFFDNRTSNVLAYKITKLFLCFFTFLYSIFIIKIKNISLLIVLCYLWYIDSIENRKIQLLEKVYKLIEKSNF